MSFNENFKKEILSTDFASNSEIFAFWQVFSDRLAVFTFASKMSTLL